MENCFFLGTIFPVDVVGDDDNYWESAECLILYILGIYLFIYEHFRTGGLGWFNSNWFLYKPVFLEAREPPIELVDWVGSTGFCTNRYCIEASP
ncbi:hypothetical protein QVD17_32489 [Tagetes erecta]|uniref:Uncharacterized protein n=1 Tax=Tagetes erecta TaxID=13708 RepID=A0AAD8JVL0_TARER|nr:hypothetical protein QVD17_32489 [Tagetes erecta]